MAIAAGDLESVREEVGDDPDDAAVGALWDVYGSVPRVALAILRPRLANALAAAAEGGLSIPGVISLSAPSNPAMLREQIQRLEIALAAETGEVLPDSMIGVSRLRRRSQSRGYVGLP